MFHFDQIEWFLFLFHFDQQVFNKSFLHSQSHFHYRNDSLLFVVDFARIVHQTRKTDASDASVKTQLHRKWA